MLLDLVSAAVVTVVVAVVPGLPWARALCVGQEPEDLLGWAVALSFSLVPPVALLLSAITGSGVTVAVAGGAVLLVTLAGMLACKWRWLSLRASEPPSVPPPSPGPFALALLAILGALLLYADRQDLSWQEPERVLAPLGVLTAGVVLAFRRGTILSAPTEAESENHSILRRTLLALVLLSILARGYIGVIRYDWPFLRGVDQFSHSLMAELTMQGRDIGEFLIYPPGFPALVAVASRLSGLEPLRLFALLAPSLLLLPALACYALARSLWGAWYGVAAALAVGLLPMGPYQHFYDAMYPNLIAATLLLPLAVAALLRLLRAPSAASGLLLALVGSSVVLYHSVTALYLVPLLGVVGLLVPWLWWRQRRAGLVMFGSLTALGVLAVAYVWNTYQVPSTVAALLGLAPRTGTLGAASKVLGTQPPVMWAGLRDITSAPVLWFALLGASAIVANIRHAVGLGAARVQSVLVPVVLVLWAAFLYAGSRTAESGFPQRFARDLSVPLAVFAAVGLITALRPLASRIPVGVPVALLAAAAVAAVGFENIRVGAQQSDSVLLTPQIVAAGKWLRKHNEGGRIIVSPHVNQVPSRAMLAMGGYTGLQSYAPWQLRRRRDLPPGGVKPLRDALRVVNNPTDPRTPAIIDQYDVRYVVLYKRLPPPSFWHGKRPTRWKAFKREHDLFAVAFENSDVLILRPR